MKATKKKIRIWLKHKLNNHKGYCLVNFGLIAGATIVLCGIFWHFNIFLKAWECYAYKIRDDIYEPVRHLLSGRPPRMFFSVSALYITVLILLSDYNIMSLRNLPRTLLYFLWVLLLMIYVCTCDIEPS